MKLFLDLINDNKVRLHGSSKDKDLLKEIFLSILERTNKMFQYIAKITLKKTNVVSSPRNEFNDCNLDTPMLPPELWKEITTKINYADSLCLSAVNLHLHKVVNANQHVSNFALLEKGYYTEFAFSLQEIKSAHQIAENAATFLFFKSEDKERSVFRKKLTELANSRHKMQRLAY